MVPGGEGAGLGLPGEGEPFIPAPGKVQKDLERIAHALETGIVPGEEARDGWGHAGPCGIKHWKTIVISPPVFHDGGVGGVLQPVSGLAHGFGFPLPQEIGDEGDESEGSEFVGGEDEGAIHEGAQGVPSLGLGETGEGGEVFYFGGQAEVGEGADGAGFLGGEVVCEVAEDEFERVIPRRAGAEEVEGVGEGEAVAAPDLAGGPA